MSKQNRGLIPELRFPEFARNPDWEGVYGNKAFDQINNKEHNSDLPILAITQEYGAIPRKLIDYNVSVTEKSIQSYKVVDVGDFIISLRSFQGGIEYSDYRGLCSPAYVVLRHKEGIEKRFFKHYFKSQPFIQDLTKNLEGLRDGKMISYKQFSEILLPKPSPEEQIKIADCLAPIDELITLHMQKLDALKTHKRGLMQQLFPAEGETVPNLRFPDFRNQGNWKEVPLSTQVELISGLHLAPDGYADVGDIPYFTGPSDYTNNIDFVSKWTKVSDNVGRTGDTIITVKGSGVGELLRLELDEVALGRQLMAVRPKSLHEGFLFHFLATKRQLLIALASGNLIPGLSRRDILGLRILTPESDREQQMVSDYLSSIDEMIALQVKEVDSLKSYKKGVMQKLFPVMSEVY